MPNNIQDNLLHPKEWHVRTELWRDKIYHIPFNPYKFPKNDGSGDFLPKPKRFQEIITEFKKFIDEQKATERTEEDYEEAKNRIKAIKQELKEWVETLIATYGLELTEEEQEQIKAFQPALNFFFLHQWQKWSKNTFPKQEETIYSYEPEAGGIELPGAQENIFNEEAEQEIITEILTILEAWKEKATNEEKPAIIKAMESLTNNSGTKKEQWNLINDLTLYSSDFPDAWKIADYLQQWELLYNPSKEKPKSKTELLEVREKIVCLIKEWEKQKKILLDRKNICFIEKDNQDNFIFCYQPPKGDFHALDDFLWYRNNIWYETVRGGWQRINHENAIVIAKRSTFIHNYHNFFLKGANGIFHNHPKFINRQEICQCPSFLESTIFLDFACDWQPNYKLWQLDNQVNGFSHSKDGARVPYLSTVKLKKLENASDFNRGLKQVLFFLLPEEYNDDHTVWMKPAFRINFSSKHTSKSLVEWAKKKEIFQGMNNEHLLKHCVVQFFWNSKLIYTNTLDNLSLENMFVDVKANASGIMYKFQSGNIFFRWSEDVQFNIDRSIAQEMVLDTASSSIQGALQGAASGGAAAGGPGALAGGLAGLVGGLFNMAKGERKTVENMTLQHIHNQVETKEDKSQDEGQTERKTKYVGTANIVSSAIGSLPSILNPSYTKNDYTLIEFVLRYNDLPLQMRVQYNENLAERYTMTKTLKKNGNEVFNTERIGNWLQKGYIKAIPNVLEGDRNGYFASLLSRGVYVYDHDPSEYFKEKVERQSHENVSLLQTTTLTMTTIQENYSSAIGRDDQVHVDDKSWVWMDSYCRGAGEDLFPGLIEQGREHIKVQTGTQSQPTYIKWQLTKNTGKEIDWNSRKYVNKEEWDKIANSSDVYKSREYDYSRLVWEPKSGTYTNKQTQKPPTDEDKKWYTCQYREASGINYHENMQNTNENEYNSLPKNYSGLKVGDWWGYKYMTGAGAWKFDGYAKWSGEATLKTGVKYEWYMHAFSGGQKDGRAFRGLDDGVKVILKQDGADWELAFVGKVEITETIGNPDLIGSGLPGTEIMGEELSNMEDKEQTTGMESMEKEMKAEVEQQDEFDKELLDDLQRQDEKTKEKDDELEPEPEATKDKVKEDDKSKADDKNKEDEDDVERSNEK